MMRQWVGTGPMAFAVVFAGESACFVLAAALVLRLGRADGETSRSLPLRLPAGGLEKGGVS
ncbi:hypothetical protein [Telmatospirillum siberiense]|uniref:hypothetical protein n=1 Tax=Telmatospirillum siberiense TaxID=382514 RepID=UPI003B83464B